MTTVIVTTWYLIVPYVLALLGTIFELKKHLTGVIVPLLSFLIYIYVLTFSMMLGSNLEEEIIFGLVFFIVYLLFYFIRRKKEEKK